MSFRFGREQENHVVFRNISREFPRATDKWDGNWLSVDLEMVGSPFTGSRSGAWLRADDFAGLLRQLRTAREDLSHTFAFRPVEPWIVIEATGDGRGHFSAKCETGLMGAKLLFEVNFDRTDLELMIVELERVVMAFPVRGSDAGHRG